MPIKKSGLKKHSPLKKSKFLLSWSEAAACGPEIAGGKGWHLGRLAQNGFLIPDGIVLPVRAYQEYVRNNGMAGLCKKAWSLYRTKAGSEACAAALAEVKARFMEGDFSPAARKMLARAFAKMQSKGAFLAVRSSYSLEDSSLASCAGIFQSILQVRGQEALFAAIRQCYASAWTDQALAYLLRKECSPGSMAVVIMKMVSAAAAGVAVVGTPLPGGAGGIRINANDGIGESVVSGQVDPDDYVLQARLPFPRLLKKHIGRKEYMVVPAAGGGTRREPGRRHKTAVLSDAAIRTLGLMILRCQAVLTAGGSWEVEWAFDGWKFWLLQIRPVVEATPAATGADIWKYSHFAPGIHSPLGWSNFSTFLQDMMEAPMRAVQEDYHPARPLLCLHQGRIYFNLSYLSREMWDYFGVTPGEFGEDFGYPAVSGSQATKTLNSGQKWRRLLVLARMISARAGGEQLLRRLHTATARLTATNLRELSVEGLLQYGGAIQSLLEKHRAAQRVQLLTVYASIAYKAVAGFLRRWFGKKSLRAANSILINAASTQQNPQAYGLEQLAHTALTDTAAKTFFTRRIFRPLDWKKHLPSQSPFGRDFTGFLEQYGHRCAEETDLQNPRWREDPTDLLLCIRALMKDFEGQRTMRVNSQHEHAWREIHKHLGATAVWVLKHLVRHAQRSTALREKAKAVLAYPADALRSLALEIGRRYAKQGWLAEARDVFYCTWPELVVAAVGDSEGRFLRSLARQRQKEYAGYEDVSLAEDLKPAALSTPIVPARTGSKGRAYSCLGVSSGCVQGKVRMIRNVREGFRLQPGDILAAYCVDTGWLPLLLRAAGLIIGRGGYLAHGATIARELGIPAVSNAHALLPRLKDGSRIIVDGDQGEVRIV
ncbi:hypothetical protein JW933_03220 [candidate division FCPU426 bacterium]|nr:hypothetical protein [candidate division FCPU426 bacterium]